MKHLPLDIKEPTTNQPFAFDSLFCLYSLVSLALILAMHLFYFQNRRRVIVRKIRNQEIAIYETPNVNQIVNVKGNGNVADFHVKNSVLILKMNVKLLWLVMLKIEIIHFRTRNMFHFILKRSCISICFSLLFNLWNWE